ncbi:hypothetical protein GALMADRAFT_147049 [Galerina marginata CBS 339.88]|uniref:Uncharacterized protein n=1 Tax=Galerina marginata (strain CBS 339.88) TaxID=685588 RepID=A0A067S9D3_GALM3|nr:hypothetical protein GALMADRAFT_147049 [Galerina marginata CBS 339.88]
MLSTENDGPTTQTAALALATRFIVSRNSRITPYKWAAEYPEIQRVIAQHDLQFMKIVATYIDSVLP